MARLARVEVFDPSEIAIVHVMNRVVRRCFLFGDDPISGKNFDHRKVWIEDQLRLQAACFGIDLLGFAIMPNHFHLILRSRPDCVEQWDDTEIARRWLTLCPFRKTADGQAAEPTDEELNTIRLDTARLKEIRSRLSDISWWMRILCQQIARRAGTVPKRWILARLILTNLRGWASKPLGKFNSGKEATHAKIIGGDVDYQCVCRLFRNLGKDHGTGRRESVQSSDGISARRHCPRGAGASFRSTV